MVRNVAEPASLPAPIGGWNARDSIAAMASTDAVELENFFPYTTDVGLRFGYSMHVTEITGQVETTMAYNGAATEELYAIAVDSVYNVTTAGAVGAAVLGSLTNARWQYINVATAGGNFIEMCNGADAVHTYNGSSWTSQAGNITGVTSSNLININLHKNRVWFIEKDNLKAWYLPTQSISGLAKSLDLSAFCPQGGFLMAMGTWTIDAGYGVDDLAVFITSQGDVAVFRGTDPASATTWALVGMWSIGAPIGRRCFQKQGGDLLIITEDGLQPMSLALQSSRVDPRTALTDKIRDAMSIAVQDHGSNFGWELVNFPPLNMLLMNVPITEGDIQQQYVMNTITGAWCNFKGWNANCFTMFKQNELYFGTNQGVGRAWNTNGDAGLEIPGKALQAFSYFGNPGQVKRFTMMRPTFRTNGNIPIQGNINVDFDLTTPTSDLSNPNSAFTSTLWDSAIWDSSTWSDTLGTIRSWQGATGVGYAGAPSIAAQGVGFQLEWLSTEIVLEKGGIV